ncbi:MAG TPA: class I SAM-dependent methyltransferase [Blastocatellia bacterium]|nr:class I SAM-dependent methyltransferase [Blastocatellia bacterium]
MSKEKEKAYRYDLFVTPDWRDRFDTLINEKLNLASEGRLLDVNSGTGAHAIELAEKMNRKGEVVATDADLERIELSRAKAQVKKVSNVAFEHASGDDLPFDNDEFDLVIGDASLLPPDEVEDTLSEMVRVAQPGGRVILKLATSGSFDEFFSIYWEALNNLGLVEDVWTDLEEMIKARRTASDAEALMKGMGLKRVESFTSKEEFEFETGGEFLESPMIQDLFLDEWLEIIPGESRQDVYDQIVTVIERERAGAPYDVSIKATVLAGVK